MKSTMVGSGRLFISGRPKSYAALASLIDVVVICLRENEGLYQLVIKAHDAGLNVIHCPFVCKDFPNDPIFLKLAVRDAADRLLQGGYVLVHCAAGIHRTGLIAYGILRTTGSTHQEAIDAIIAMRPECRDAVRFIERFGEEVW